MSPLRFIVPDPPAAKGALRFGRGRGEVVLTEAPAESSGAAA